MAGTPRSGAAPRESGRHGRVLRVTVLLVGAVLIAWAGPLLISHGPSAGRAAFVFELVVTLGGAAALAGAMVGPTSRVWPAALTLTAMSVVAIVLLVAFALYAVIAQPDWQGP